jgi:hypothetical protein
MLWAIRRLTGERPPNGIAESPATERLPAPTCIHGALWRAMILVSDPLEERRGTAGTNTYKEG